MCVCVCLSVCLSVYPLTLTRTPGRRQRGRETHVSTSSYETHLSPSSNTHQGGGKEAEEHMYLLPHMTHMYPPLKHTPGRRQRGRRDTECTSMCRRKTSCNCSRPLPKLIKYMCIYDNYIYYLFLCARQKEFLQFCSRPLPILIKYMRIYDN